MEYAADKDQHSVHIISVLIANGASLLASYVIDPRTNQSITVKERLQKLGGEYKALIDKSIFTITRKVHKLLFDFPVIGKEEIDLLKLVSEIPSEDGYFVESGQKIALFNKIGSEGASEFMDLLRACAKEINLKETSAISMVRDASAMFRGTSSKKEFEEAYAKLYGCIEVGYSAIKTRDDKVIVDYLSEINEEARQSRNPHLKKLYERFYTLLSDYNDLPKSFFMTRLIRYAVRTAKSYSGWEWSPAWEKILTGPGYRTDVGEWSKNKFEEIEKAERDEESIRLAESEARSRALEQSLEQETQARQGAEQRAEQEAQRAKQEAQARQGAEQKAKQEAQARQSAEQKAEQEAQARQSAEQKTKQLEQALEQKNLEKVAIRACNRKLAKLDDELQDAINEESENKIVEAAMSYTRGSPEQVVDAIIEEIKINREQIIKEGRVSAEIIKAGVRNFSNQGTSLSDVSVSQGINAGMGRK